MVKLEKNKTVLITGSSSGIGRALAEILWTKTECGLVLLSHDAKGLEETLAELKQKKPSINARVLQTLVCDLTNESAVQKTAKELFEKTGHIDILINNAGVGLFEKISETSTEDAKAVFDVNFWGAFYLTKACLPAMRKQGEGLIANVSSIVGKYAPANQGIYAASKAALERFTEALAAEEEKYGIHTLLVLPERTQTKFLDNVVGKKSNAVFPGKQRKIKTPEQVARQIFHAIQGGNRVCYVSPQGRVFALLSVTFPAVIKKVMNPSLKKEVS